MSESPIPEVANVSEAMDRPMVADVFRAQFDDFTRRDGDRLLHAAFGLCGDWQHAEDLVQQVLATVARRWDIVSANPAGYAYRCLTRANIDRWRRTRRRPEVIAEPSVLASLAGDNDRSDGREDAVDLRLSVVAMLCELPIRQRSIIVLKYLLDRPEAEVAEILGISVGAVKSGGSRALSRLRDTSTSYRKGQ